MSNSPKPNSKQSQPASVTADAGSDGVALEAVAQQPRQAIVGAVYVNTQTNIIQITEDKVHLALEKFAQRLSLDGLVAPLGIELSLLAVLGTADFKTDHIGVPAAVWQGIFIGTTVLVAIWLLVASFARFIRGSRDKAVKTCIKEMRGTDGAVTLFEQQASAPPKKG